MAIKRALISVSDKTGVVEFARGLHELGVEIVSTGGTMRTIKEAGIPVISVSEVTGFPEMMDGRVKTLHPKVHGGILAIRDNPEHVKAMKEHGITGIDLVAVNLYPFRETIARPGVTLAEAIENIDIGGPSMVRAAAKNYKYVTVVVDPSQYGEILERIRKDELTEEFRLSLSRKAFLHTGLYDCAIADYLTRQVDGSDSVLPDVYSKAFTKIQDLRYGENPHQKAAFYRDPEAKGGIAMARQLHGKELSYNNIVDMEAAWDLASEWKDEVCCAIIKHTNPCGTALGSTTLEAFNKAFAADSKSAYGGIVAFNRVLDGETAAAMKPIFLEVVMAPKISKEALDILGTKKNIRLIEVPSSDEEELQLRKVSGGLLVQTPDNSTETRKDCRVVTNRAPTEDEWKAMEFAWKIVKHVKSNAIVLTGPDVTYGVGAGQMNRVGSAEIAIKEAGDKCRGAALASDAFFPFGDTIEAAGKAGITCVIQPGGSIRDQESIDMANKYNIAMVFTGHRHFRHS
jgi:phosphoribosylaminoimidazolecarboxamide formyltransferase/IMP cyclohydrolase